MRVLSFNRLTESSSRIYVAMGPCECAFQWEEYTRIGKSSFEDEELGHFFKPESYFMWTSNDHETMA